MSDTGKDVFDKLSDLLFGARERYCSVRASIEHTVVMDVAGEANRRFIDWRFDRGNPGIAWVGKPAPPQREDFYFDYEDSRETVRLWHEKPERWREEAWTPEGVLRRCDVAENGGPWWLYGIRDTAIYVPAVPAGERPDMEFSFMLDPSNEEWREAWVDEAYFYMTDQRTAVAGREALEFRAETISWGYPPGIFQSFGAGMEGTTDHLILVDAEIGTILRVAARLEGREFRIAEVSEISYDKKLPDDTFRLELPGVEFRRSERPDV